MTFYLFVTNLHPSTSLNLNLFYSRRGQSCLMDRGGLVTQRSQVRVLGRNCRWGEWMSSALSTLNTPTEVPLSKAQNAQLLPGSHSINDYPLLRVCVHGVCVHFGWVKCRAWFPSMGHHTWPHVTSLLFYSINFIYGTYLYFFTFKFYYLHVVVVVY